MLRGAPASVRIAFLGWLVVGGAVLVGLVLASPIVLGAQGVAEWLAALGRVDFALVFAAAFALFWLPPILIVAGLPLLVRIGWLDSPLGRILRDLLSRRGFPVDVAIDQPLPIVIERALEVPIEIDTHLAIHQDVDIDTRVPIRAMLPVDTKIETRVLGIGNVRLPIRTQIPIDLVVPLKTRLRLDIPDLPVSIRDRARIELPPLDARVKTVLRARVRLFDAAETDAAAAPDAPASAPPDRSGEGER